MFFKGLSDALIAQQKLSVLDEIWNSNPRLFPACNKKRDNDFFFAFNKYLISRFLDLDLSIISASHLILLFFFLLFTAYLSIGFKPFIYPSDNKAAARVTVVFMLARAILL